MADEFNVEVKLESKEKKRIQELRKTQREIAKEIKTLQSLNKDVAKVEEWKMIHELKQEVKNRLDTVGVSWRKFLDTPDWFEYAYKDGNRIKVSLAKPTGVSISEAEMQKMAMEKRQKMVSAKKRKKKTTKSSSNKSGGSKPRSGIR